MERKKIQTISKNKTIDYGHEKVNNFWLKINNNSNYQAQNNNLKQIIFVFNNTQDSIICIQTEELNKPEIIKAVYNASKKRNRIYILTNNNDESLKQLEGACLVRYGIKNIGSFILVNPNTGSAKGIIYTAPFIETSLANAENIVLELDNEQVKTLFRFFSDNFWHKAEYEIIDNDSFDTLKETEDPPLDFLPNIKDFCDADFVKTEISKINNAAIISVPNLQTNDLLNFTTLKISVILTRLKNNDAELLRTIAINNSIYSVKNNSKRVAITENNNWLIPKTNISKDDIFFALKLNSNQIENLDDLINDKIDNAEFEFNLSKTRKELENKTIRLLDNVESEIKIKSKSSVEANNIELAELFPKEELEKQEPEFTDDNISVEINYSWQIIPFFTPQNAKKAKLYAEWEKYQNEYKAFISQIEEAINKSESKTVGEKLKRFFLSKKQTISKYQEELNKLKSKNLSIIEITERKEIIKTINELAKKVSANLSEIDTEIKKSEIKTEKENLKKEKEEKELELSIYIEEQEAKLKEQEEKKESRLTEFCKKYKIKENELASFKAKLTQKAEKKNRKKNPKEVENAQKTLNELKYIQGFDFSKKYEDEKQKFEKEIKNIEIKINNKEKELERVGKEKQQREDSSLSSIIGGGQNNKNSKQINEFIIPKNLEYLPEIGELFEVGKQKYLEIEFWEDFELGQTETQRLNAKLSAKKTN